MANFIIRVVLHDAENDREAYNNLHAEMLKHNYYRTIKSDDGILYDLPPATYRASADWTSKKIRDHVREIADTTGYKNSVLATRSRGSAWSGLKKV